MFFSFEIRTLLNLDHLILRCLSHPFGQDTRSSCSFSHIVSLPSLLPLLVLLPTGCGRGLATRSSLPSETIVRSVACHPSSARSGYLSPGGQKCGCRVMNMHHVVERAEDKSRDYSRRGLHQSRMVEMNCSSIARSLHSYCWLYCRLWSLSASVDPIVHGVCVMHLILPHFDRDSPRKPPLFYTFLLYSRHVLSSRVAYSKLTHPLFCFLLHRFRLERVRDSSVAAGDWRCPNK